MPARAKLLIMYGATAKPSIAMTATRLGSESTSSSGSVSTSRPTAATAMRVA